MFTLPEKFRITKSDGKYNPIGLTKPGDDTGCFSIPVINGNLFIVASSGLGWEHVSIHLNYTNGKQGTPSWSQMCLVKDTFWGDEDCVVQFHPPKSEYVNTHAHCLHLWRPTDFNIPTPPKIMV
jgi:hypothetical protein